MFKQQSYHDYQASLELSLFSPRVYEAERERGQRTGLVMAVDELNKIFEMDGYSKGRWQWQQIRLIWSGICF